MIYLILWCLNGFGGAYGDICEAHPLGTCQEHLHSSNVSSIESFPNVDQIKSVCPPVTAYLNCIEEYKNKCDFDDFGLFTTEEEFVKVQDFVSDICNITSTLHKRYVDNAECLISVNEDMTECTRVAGNIYHDYAEFKKNHIPERDEPFVTNNALCVSKSYSVMCAVMKTLTHCGPKTYDLSVELVNRSNFLQNFCKRMELYDHQTTFMDFLGIDEEQRKHMIPVFKP